MQYMTFGRFFLSYRSVSSKMNPYKSGMSLMLPVRVIRTHLRQANFPDKIEEYVDIVRMAKIQFRCLMRIRASIARIGGIIFLTHLVYLAYDLPPLECPD